MNMKNTVITLTLGLCVALSSSAFAAGSKIKKSVIINKSLNNKVLNAAIGTGSKANVGSVNISGSKIKKSVIINKSLNNKVLNAAIGKNSTANVGSVNID